MTVFDPIASVPLRFSVPFTPKFELPVIVPLEIVRFVKVSVPLFVIDEPEPIVIVPAGLKVAPEFTFRLFVTEKLLLVVTVALVEIARLKKESVELFVILEPSNIVIVPADAVRFLLEFTVRVPPTEKLEAVVTVPSIVSEENLSIPELFVIDDVPLMVIVPLEGLKSPPAFTVRTVLTVKLELVVGVPATTSFENVNDPEFEIEELLFNVTVSFGANTAAAPRVKVPLIPNLEEVVTVALAGIVIFEKFNVPELTMDAPLFNVTVPPGLLNVPVAVKTPFTVGFEDPVTVPLILRSAYWNAFEIVVAEFVYSTIDPDRTDVGDFE